MSATDRRTDRITITKTVQTASHGKNRTVDNSSHLLLYKCKLGPQTGRTVAHEGLRAKRLASQHGGLTNNRTHVIVCDKFLEGGFDGHG